MTWYSEKMMISYSCIRGFMPNSQKNLEWYLNVEIDSRKDLPEVGSVEERKSKSSGAVKFKWIPPSILLHILLLNMYLNQFFVIVSGKNLAHKY